MLEEKLTNWDTETTHPHKKILLGILIVLMLPMVYWFVYATGGIKYVYSHSMYIPILLAGIFFGLKGGLLVGITAGIVLGPLMPLEVSANLSQPLINWVFRLLIFTGTGVLAGYGVDRFNIKAKTIRKMLLYNTETNIPNINAMEALCTDLPKGPKTIITVMVSNHQDIIDALSTDVYSRILHRLYMDIKESDDSIYAIIQGDTHKLWIVKQHNDLEKEANALLETVSNNQYVDGVPIYLDVSLGLSMIKDVDACDTLESYRVSDSLAREAQKNNLSYAIKNEELDRKIKEYDLVSRFSESFYKEELSLAFQSQVNLKSGKTTAAEALLRWNHPTLGSVSPGQFIPLVEETKLIHSLTNWVIENALKAVKSFEDNQMDLNISINISAKNLHDPDFYKRTMAIIEKSEVSPEKIIFEITESALMSNPKKSQKALDKFVAKGLRIAIDDFGAGYSSLAYLSRFPIHIVKIDRYFISQLIEEDAIMRIVKSTINLAHELGYEVIAEGVETKESHEKLKELNGTFAQGYYYSRPIPLSNFIEKMSE